MKTSNLNFQIEDITKDGDNVQVFYFINDGELQEANIAYDRLKLFAVDMGMNSYCEDVLMGDYKYYHIDIYMEENLGEVVKYFIESTYNPFEAISAALSDLMAIAGKVAA